MKVLENKLVRIIVIVVIAVSAFLAVFSIGKPIYVPFQSSISLGGPEMLALDDNGNIRAVIDSNGKRLLSLNEKQEVVAESTLSKIDDSLTSYKSVAYYKDKLYVTLVTGKNSNYAINNEKVLKFNPDLGHCENLYEFDHSNDISKYPCFKNFEINSDRLYLVRATSSDDNSLQIIDITNEPKCIHQFPLKNISGEVTFADYNFNCNQYAFITDNGKLYISGANGEAEQVADSSSVGVLQSLTVTDTGKVIMSLLADTNVYIYSDSRMYKYIEDIGAKYITINSKLYLCDDIDHSIKVYSKEDVAKADSSFQQASYKPVNQPLEVYTEFNLSANLFILNIVIWFSYLVLLLFVLIVVIRSLLKFIQKGQLNKIFTLCTASLVLGAVVLIAVYMGSTINNQIGKTYHSQLETNSGALTTAIEKSYSSYENGNNFSFSDFINSTSRDLYVQDQKMAHTELPTTSFVLVKNNDQIHFVNSVCSFSSENHERLNDLYTYLNEGNPNTIKLIDLYINDNKNYSIGYCPIVDSKCDVVGYVACYTDSQYIMLRQFSFLKDCLIAMLAIGGILVLVVLELKSFFIMLRVRRKEIKTDKNPEIWATRGMQFFCVMSSGFDCTISFLIAKDMLAPQGINDPILFGLPAMFSCIGIMLGGMLSAYLAHKVPCKKLALMCIIPSVLLNIVTACVVSLNLFWIFCILKLVTDFVLASYSRSLTLYPLRTQNEKRRAKISKEMNLSTLSANAIGGILAGFIATYLGNACVYLASVVPLLFAIVYCIKMLPKNTVISFERESSDKQDFLPAIKMMLSPQIIALFIFGLCSSMLAYNYKSILFPLFASDSGMSKVEINNIIALANVLIFALTPIISEKFKKLDYWYQLILSLLIAGLSLILCFVNNSIVWCFVILLVTGYAHRVILSCVMILWPREAAKRGLRRGHASFFVQIVWNTLDIVKTPILSSVVVAGQIAACVGVGTWTVVASGIFALLSKNSSLRKK